MKITLKKAKELGKIHKIDYKLTPFNEFLSGLKTEMEHLDIIKEDYDMLTKIVKAHLKENSRYYYFLQKAGL